MINELEIHARNILKWMKRNAYTFTGCEGYIESKLGWIGIANYINQTTGKDDYGNVILVLKNKRVFRVIVEKNRLFPPELIENHLILFIQNKVHS